MAAISTSPQALRFDWSIESIRRRFGEKHACELHRLQRSASDLIRERRSSCSRIHLRTLAPLRRMPSMSMSASIAVDPLSMRPSMKRNSASAICPMIRSSISPAVFERLDDRAEPLDFVRAGFEFTLAFCPEREEWRAGEHAEPLRLACASSQDGGVKRAGFSPSAPRFFVHFAPAVSLVTVLSRAKIKPMPASVAA